MGEHFRMNSASILLIFALQWLSARAFFEESSPSKEYCYSCSSGNFEHRWPKNRNGDLLYLVDTAMISNDSCDTIGKAPLPVVHCPNSVCAKFVVQESLSSRAVCSAQNNFVIVRDCWSRVLFSEDPSLQLRPLSDKPVKLANVAGQKQTVGQIFTCSGYLCNGQRRLDGSFLLLMFSPLLLAIITR
ncbi:Calcineurin-like phosphoesterase domain, lpxH type-containing protein [Aphelenchoides fujianensis]|nr:Calcineurin-like phosphoesterase domain, lpxH type-containing protein [Aphelenchoides fujianensis]